MSQRCCEGMNGTWQGNNLFVIPTAAKHQRLYLDIALWHNRAVAGDGRVTSQGCLRISSWYHRAVSGYHSVTSQCCLRISSRYHRAVSGYHSVTSQGCIWVSSCDITMLYLDIILIKCCIWISPWSQYCSWIVSCDITGLYLDIVLWHHSATCISGYHSVTVTSEGPFPLSPVLVQYPSYKYWKRFKSCAAQTNRCNHVHTYALSLSCGSTSLPGIVALETCTSGKACAHHIL